jgi:hypothetical protein
VAVLLRSLELLRLELVDVRNDSDQHLENLRELVDPADPDAGERIAGGRSRQPHKTRREVAGRTEILAELEHCPELRARGDAIRVLHGPCFRGR